MTDCTPKLDNLLCVESMLVERLRDQLADLVPRVHVLTAADLAAVTEKTQVTPAVHVVYQGCRVSESRSDGRIARLEQTWLAVVAARNMRTLATGEAARADAGEIALRVCKALMGYKPEHPGALLSRPLRLTTPPGPGFSAGYQYLPNAFLAELVVDSL